METDEGILQFSSRHIGASSLAFISDSLARRLYLVYQTLPSPITLTGFEGRKVPLVSHEVSFYLKIGNHSEPHLPLSLTLLNMTYTWATLT